MMDTASEYPSTIDVCVVDSPDESCSERHYDEFTIVARRMSISRIFARNSMAWARDSLEKLPIRLTLSNIGILTVIIAILMPRVFTYVLVYPIFRLVFGTLYPAYASYKAVRTKNVKEYVKWMMYWIVFALFTCAETFTDVFFSFWFPFYYEIKIILVLWLLSPATKGSSILYRRFVHPALSRREAEIDEALARATEQGYTAVLHLGTRGVNYATTVLMQTAIKNFPNVVPNTLSVLPASQSDSAISSLANPRASREARKDSPDGPEHQQQRRRTRSDDLSLNLDTECLDNSTDEEITESEPEFKVPAEKIRKQKKERIQPKRNKSRNRREDLVNFEVDFSDEIDVN